MEHGFLVVEELLQRAVHLVDDPALEPEVVQREALGLERGGAVVMIGMPPVVGALFRFTHGGQHGQPLLIFGDHMTQRGALVGRGGGCLSQDAVAAPTGRRHWKFWMSDLP